MNDFRSATSIHQGQSPYGGLYQGSTSIHEFMIVKELTELITNIVFICKMN